MAAQLQGSWYFLGQRFGVLCCLSPPLPSGVQISKQNTHGTFDPINNFTPGLTRLKQGEVPSPLPPKVAGYKHSHHIQKAFCADNKFNFHFVECTAAPAAACQKRFGQLDPIERERLPSPLPLPRSTSFAQRRRDAGDGRSVTTSAERALNFGEIDDRD